MYKQSVSQRILNFSVNTIQIDKLRINVETINLRMKCLSNK